MTFKSRLIFLAIILGATLSFLGIKDLLVLWKEPVDVLNEDPATLTNGMHVHTTVDLVLDQFIEETSYDTVNGIKVSAEKESARYYALPYLKVEGDWIMIDKMVAIRVSVGNSACGTLEKISEETWEWWSDDTGKVDYGYTTLEVDGRLRKMTAEEKDYMIDYITVVMDCNRSEAEKYVVPYVILIENLNAAYPMTLIGLVLLAIPILIFVITKSREKRNASMIYQRPRDLSKPEGTYYQPEDSTTAPTAYGSTTYGTNTYGLNTYGSTESAQNTYPSYGGAGTAQNANPIYGNAGTAQNANPIYGGAGTAQNANPIYGNAGTAQNANPIYGNAGTAQNANPIYGNAGTAQNANPILDNAEEDPSGLSLEFLMRSDEERWRREHGGN